MKKFILNEPVKIFMEDEDESEYLAGEVVAAIQNGDEKQIVYHCYETNSESVKGIAWLGFVERCQVENAVLCGNFIEEEI